MMPMTAREVSIRQKAWDREFETKWKLLVTEWQEIVISFISPVMTKMFAVLYEQNLYSRWAREAKAEYFRRVMM